MRVRAEKILRDWGTPNYPYPAREQARYMADNMQICSCYMCGNPRRQFGIKTVQERRND